MTRGEKAKKVFLIKIIGCVKYSRSYIYVTDDRPYMITLDLIRQFRSYMVRPYMV